MIAVTLEDFRAAGCCWQGISRILTLSKVSKSEFLKQGVDADLVELYAVTQPVFRAGRELVSEQQQNNTVTVRVKHLSSLGYCRRGGRKFFKRFGLDWNDFLDHGISSETLEKTGDAMAIKLIEVVRGQGR